MQNGLSLFLSPSQPFLGFCTVWHLMLDIKSLINGLWWLVANPSHWEVWDLLPFSAKGWKKQFLLFGWERDREKQSAVESLQNNNNNKGFLTGRPSLHPLPVNLTILHVALHSSDCSPPSTLVSCCIESSGQVNKREGIVKLPLEPILADSLGIILSIISGLASYSPFNQKHPAQLIVKPFALHWLPTSRTVTQGAGKCSISRAAASFRASQNFWTPHEPFVKGHRSFQYWCYCSWTQHYALLHSLTSHSSNYSSLL